MHRPARGAPAALLPFLVLTTSGTERAGAGAPAAACFAPGTTGSYVEEVSRRLQGSWPPTSLSVIEASGFVFADNERWSQTATDGSGLRQGDPTTLTWSIVPDGTTIVGQNEPTGPSNLRAWLNLNWGSQGVWLPLIQGVFDRWGALTGLRYVYEPSDDGAAVSPTNPAGGVLGVRGDVRLSGHYIDGNGTILGDILAYNYYPNMGDMVIDTGGTFLTNQANNSLRLRNTIAHEHGHGLGFHHVCPTSQTKLMEPILAENFDGPQHDDVLAGNRGYGDDLERNDSRAQSSNLGTLTETAPLSRTGISIDDDSDTDYLSFRINGPLLVSVAVEPVGLTYSSGPQSGSSCPPGPPFNSLEQQDLSFDLIDRDGSTVLRSVSANPIGLPEVLADFRLAAAGLYFLRVAGGGANLAQLYDLSLLGKAAPSTCDLMQGDVSFPPRAPGLFTLYTQVCGPELRLATLNRAGVNAGDLADAWSGGAGSLRLYQLSCPCTQGGIHLVKNLLSGRLALQFR